MIKFQFGDQIRPPIFELPWSSQMHLFGLNGDTVNDELLECEIHPFARQKLLEMYRDTCLL